MPAHLGCGNLTEREAFACLRQVLAESARSRATVPGSGVDLQRRIDASPAAVLMVTVANVAQAA
jgi:hypothetical protein